MWSWLYIVQDSDYSRLYMWSLLTEHLHAADWFDFQDPESGVRGDSVCLHCVIVLNDQLIIMKQEVVHSCWISICIFSDQCSGCDFPVQPQISCSLARTSPPQRRDEEGLDCNFPGKTNLSAGMAINVAYTSGTTDNLSRFQLWHNYMSICHHRE